MFLQRKIPFSLNLNILLIKLIHIFISLFTNLLQFKYQFKIFKQDLYKIIYSLLNKYSPSYYQTSTTIS